MIWLHALDDTPAALPAVWLIASRLRPANLAERSALRRATARELVAGLLALPPEAVAIGHDASGRPLLTHPAGAGLHLSLATRAGLVAVALADAPVGVDVELIEPCVAPPLASLHADERGFLAGQPEVARASVFARLWTAKEAYVKALGTGFARPPESFCVTLLPGDRFSIEDRQRPTPAIGHGLVIESGGRENLAAAMIVLD